MNIHYKLWMKWVLVSGLLCGSVSTVMGQVVETTLPQSLKASAAPEVLKKLASLDGVLYVKGNITPGLLEQIQGKSRSLRQGRWAIVWDSNGGDVDEAMRVGYWLKDQRIAGTYAYCASSCSMLYAASVRYLGPVNAKGRLVVHRPYLAQVYLGPGGAGSFPPGPAAMMQMLKTYCQKMTGSDAFYKKMISVDFHTPQALSVSETGQMGMAQEP